MKIKPRRKYNAYCTISELRELKRAPCNGLAYGSNNSFTDVSIIRRSYYVTLKNFKFLNFVAEGYRRKLNHGEILPIYGSSTPHKNSSVIFEREKLHFGFKSNVYFYILSKTDSKHEGAGCRDT